MATDPWVKKETTSTSYSTPKSYTAPKSRDFFQKINSEITRQRPIRMAEEAEAEKKIRMIAENPNREDAATMFASLSKRNQDRVAGTFGSQEKGRRSYSTGSAPVAGGGGMDFDKSVGLVMKANELASTWKTEYTEGKRGLPAGVLKTDKGFVDVNNPSVPLDETDFGRMFEEEAKQKVFSEAQQLMELSVRSNNANEILAAAGRGRALGIPTEDILGPSKITETRMAPGTTDIYGRTAAEAGVPGGQFRKFTDQRAVNAENFFRTGGEPTPAPTQPPDWLQIGDAGQKIGDMGQQRTDVIDILGERPGDTTIAGRAVEELRSATPTITEGAKTAARNAPFIGVPFRAGETAYKVGKSAMEFLSKPAPSKKTGEWYDKVSGSLDDIIKTNTQAKDPFIRELQEYSRLRKEQGDSHEQIKAALEETIKKQKAGKRQIKRIERG